MKPTARSIFSIFFTAANFFSNSTASSLENFLISSGLAPNPAPWDRRPGISLGRYFQTQPVPNSKKILKFASCCVNLISLEKHETG